MRVNSIMPQMRATSIRRNDNVNSSNQTMPVAMNLAAPIVKSGVILTFTGNDSKNIHQFLSYAPENKRFGVKAYNLGGLGVVAQEAPASWRTKAGADVRDFAPYHSFNNPDGGVTIVKITKNEKGIYNDRYPAESFISAKQDETLEEVGKRVKLKEGERLAYAIRLQPDDKGISQIIRLEDAGVQGSFKRAANKSIADTQDVTYRLFRAVDIADTVDIPINDYKKKVLAKITKTIKDEIAAPINEKYKEDLAKAKEKDFQLTLKARDLYDAKKSTDGERFYPIHDNEIEIQSKINDEIEKNFNTEEIKKRIDTAYNEKINSEEVKKELETIKSKIIAAPEVPERNAAYFIHTKELAKFDTAYGAGEKGYSAYGAYGTTGSYSTGAYSPNGGAHFVSTNVAFADNNRALIEILPKLNTKEHGFYNPANWWLHDRPAFITMNAIADASHFGNDYYNGLKVHGTFHNPGRDYQGAESNPFEMFKMLARPEDVETLKKHSQLEKLKKIEAKWGNNWDKAPLSERSFVNQILRPFMANFIDDYADTPNDKRTFNISMTPVAGTNINAKNMSCGTVSVNYGKEMKSLETPDIAQYLTTKLAATKTIDITNGSTPANLRLNDPTANFCQGNNINGLTKLKDGFTTYEYKPVFDDAGKFVSDNIDEVLKAKESNTKWLLDSLGDAFDKGGPQGITKMFFTDKQVSDTNASVTGHLAKYEKGDMLLMGWGRPDKQKGYPSTFQAFLDFLKDPNIDKEVKKHTKLLVGAGVWGNDADEYKWVQDIIRQIEELDGGIYKGNACYVNGFFPNRLVGCATYSIFSSRFEPCGITPLESFAAGTPVISTKTGGAPDFITAARGYLTKNPYLRNAESLKIDPAKFAGKKAKEIANILDAERMFANADELKDCIVAATSDYNLKPEEGKLAKYAEMVKDAITQKIDWHENASYNGGKTANERYMTEVFEIDKGMEGRNFEKLKRLVGEFGIAVEDGAKKLRNKWTKTIIGAGITVAALGTAAYAYMKRDDKKAQLNTQIPQTSTTTTINKNNQNNMTNPVSNPKETKEIIPNKLNKTA